jgi:hypothetical protein
MILSRCAGSESKNRARILPLRRTYGILVSPYEEHVDARTAASLMRVLLDLQIPRVVHAVGGHAQGLTLFSEAALS